MLRPFLGNAFVRRRGQLSCSRSEELYSAAAWGLDKRQTFSLEDVLCALVCDTLLKKVASRAQIKRKLNEAQQGLMIIGDEQSFVS